MPPVFQWIQDQAGIDSNEMLSLNCGIGYVLIVKADVKNSVIKHFQDEDLEAYESGSITNGENLSSSIMADGTQSKCRAVCLISGKGTNLQAIIENINNKSLNIDLISVISDNPMAKGSKSRKRRH